MASIRYRVIACILQKLYCDLWLVHLVLLRCSFRWVHSTGFRKWVNKYFQLFIESSSHYQKVMHPPRLSRARHHTMTTILQTTKSPVNHYDDRALGSLPWITATNGVNLLCKLYSALFAAVLIRVYQLQKATQFAVIELVYSATTHSSRLQKLFTT
ncbi:nucleocapsid protein [Pseudomonas phage phiPto-bp6g]|nr:nucleocapsid protein [Pseudomonas phage phiPto-bp6g]